MIVNIKKLLHLKIKWKNKLKVLNNNISLNLIRKSMNFKFKLIKKSQMRQEKLLKKIAVLIKMKTIHFKLKIVRPKICKCNKRL